jgi:hypothetical protein
MGFSGKFTIFLRFTGGTKSEVILIRLKLCLLTLGSFPQRVTEGGVWGRFP